MNTKKYTYWEDEGMYIGYLIEYPDYMTQGKNIGELQDNLKDIYKELTSGTIPCVRKVSELEV
jgi:predicted RNase H-like HicB family nuclease